jgi:hypothetical protein
MAAELRDPRLCWGALVALRKKMPFDQVCIIFGKPVVLALNTRSPLHFVTSLDVAGIAGLVFESGKSTGRDVNAYVEYQGVILLDMPWRMGLGASGFSISVLFATVDREENCLAITKGDISHTNSFVWRPGHLQSV